MGILGGFGSTLIGGLVSAMLYGITTLQTYVYYTHYSEDGSTTKFIVAAIWILDTLHISFMCHTLYYYLITNYGVPTSLEYIVWSFSASALVNSFVIPIVQLFFVRQVYYICRRQLRWLVTTPIVLLVLVRIGFGMAANIAIMLVNNTITFAWHTRFYSSTPAMSAVALAEVLITVSLCILLYVDGSHSAIPRTKRLLNTLILYAVNRCLLTSLVAIAELVVDVDALAAWTMASDFIVGKLYANSLLASLNTRQHLRSHGSGPQSDLLISTVRFANPPKLSGVIGCSKDRVGRSDQCKVVVIDIIARPALGETTTLQREAEV